MSILSEILATKHTEVARKKEKVRLEDLEECILNAPPVRDFRAALRSAPAPALIAEIKKASPSKGVIREDFHPRTIARTYAENGAACLSVLTDMKYFQGEIEYLPFVHEAAPLPLLRKDFIVDPWQIAESRAAWADALLLIVAALSTADLSAFIKTTQEYGMAAVVEVHDQEEMEVALSAGADLIGINNRDLHTFRTKISVTLDLVKDLPPDPDRMIISESGIFTRQDVEQLRDAGVHAILVGESLMREADIGAKMRELLGR